MRRDNAYSVSRVNDEVSDNDGLEFLTNLGFPLFARGFGDSET